VLKDKLS